LITFQAVGLKSFASLSATRECDQADRDAKAADDGGVYRH
jgi:hypothetical protein